jgi:hypothetical protein
MPKLEYHAEADSGIIEFYVDGVLLTTWGYEDHPEDSFKEFKAVFNAGYNAAKSK